MSDYTRAELVSDREALDLSATDTELLVRALDYELERVERLLERGPEAQLEPLARYSAHLAELRDAIHSVVTDPPAGAAETVAAILELEPEPSPSDPLP